MAQVTLTTALKLLSEVWGGTLHEEATEEQVIIQDFNPADVEKIENKLYIRKLAAISGTKPSSGSYGGSGSAITYTANTENYATMTPTFAYAAVEIERPVLNRTNLSLGSPYRNMLKKGIATTEDVDGGVLAASLTTNIRGSGAVHLDKSLITSSLAALVASCKGHFKTGQTPIYANIHPAEIAYLMNISDFTLSYARGPGDAPIRTGWMSETMGMTFKETGNVYQAAGVTHNLLHVPECFAKGYNERAHVLPVQEFELVVRIFAVVEYGQVEVWDAYGLDLQTAA